MDKKLEILFNAFVNQSFIFLIFTGSILFITVKNQKAFDSFGLWFISIILLLLGLMGQYLRFEEKYLEKGWGI